MFAGAKENRRVFQLRGMLPILRTFEFGPGPKNGKKVLFIASVIVKSAARAKDQNKFIKPRHISKKDIDMCGCLDNSNQIGKLVQAQMQSLGQSSFFFQRNCVGYHI